MQEFLSYNEDSKISPQPILSYDQHFGEQPLHFHVEPPETVSSHKLEYYEVCYLQSLMGYVTVNEEDRRWIAKSLDVYMYREEYGPWAMGLI